MCRLVCFQFDSLLIKKKSMYPEPIYKALARQPLYLGIPLIPLLLVGITGFSLALLIYMPAVVFVFLILYVMRSLCEKDEQLFHQLYLYWLLNYKSFPNRAYWKSVISFAPNVKEKEIPLLISRADQTFLASKELNQHD